MTYIDDRTYGIISEEVYDRSITAESYKNDDIPDWKVVEPEGAMLHDTDGSGFDATVFYNEKNNQVIIGYRGTEPPDRPKWSVLMDWGTDASDVVGGRPKNLEKMHESYERNKEEIAKLPLQSQLAFHNSEAKYQNNQFVQAENLYNAVKREYPNAEISTTGHSLGGAEAEYVAVRNGLPSVSYNAPSIVHLLSDDIQKKMENGDYRNTNIAYVNPGDGVGSGVDNAKSHVGETYFINSNFEDANKLEFKMSLPFSLPLERRDNVLAQLALGSKWMPIRYIPITLSLGQQGEWLKIYNSFFGKETHSMKHFKFDDQAGNISNSLFTMDGKAVDGNPRLEAYERTIAARDKIKEVLGDWMERYGDQPLGTIGQLAAASFGIDIEKTSFTNTRAYFAGNKGGVTIQLTPEELRNAAQKMRASLHGFSSDTKATIQMFQTQIATSKSQVLTPIARNATASLERINRWYQESITEIAEYIERKEQLFTMADQQ